MAFSQSDLTNIESAIASGVKKAVIDGKEVQYQDLPAMLLARDLIKSSLAAQQTPSKSYPRFQKADFSEDTSGSNPTGYCRCR